MSTPTPPETEDEPLKLDGLPVAYEPDDFNVGLTVAKCEALVPKIVG